MTKKFTFLLILVIVLLAIVFLKDFQKTQEWFGISSTQDNKKAIKTLDNQTIKLESKNCSNWFDRSKINDGFYLWFVADPPTESHVDVLLENLATREKNLIAKINNPSLAELCGDIGCRTKTKNKVVFSDDGSIVAFNFYESLEEVSKGNKLIIVSDTQSGEQILSAYYDHFALSSDGKRLVVGGHSWKHGWQLSMYRLDTKTKEALSGMDWDVIDEFGKENSDYQTIEVPEEWYDARKFKEFIFSNNGEVLILAQYLSQVNGNDSFYNFKNKKLDNCIDAEINKPYQGLSKEETKKRKQEERDTETHREKLERLKKVLQHYKSELRTRGVN